MSEEPTSADPDRSEARANPARPRSGEAREHAASHEEPRGLAGGGSERAEVALARLAAGLAHEIKNPLSTMAINLALLEEEWGRAANGRESEPSAREKRCAKRVTTLQREVRRLETIVDDFLRYARGGEVNRAPHDLPALVREVLDFVELEDSRLSIRHHADLPAGLPLVMLDPGAFRQALLNLFVNARQAMPEGGELIVRVQREGNFVELSVTDTGVGMRPEDLERCFEIYYSTKKGGTGLGLSTTRRIVEEHGGTITVVSELGRGTSFSIVLPLLVEIHGGAGAAREPGPRAGGDA
jgi:two-component system sensor histidine kinase HydH